MAINIIGANLNTLGNAGNFETDRSTWGFPNETNIVHTRSSIFKSKGIFGCQTEFTSTVFNILGVKIVPCSFSAIGGKNYTLRAKVRAFSSDNPADDSLSVYIANDFTELFEFTILESLGSTIADIKTAEQMIELRIRAEVTKTFTGFWVYIGSGGGINVGGRIYFDEFEIYEYEDVVFTCTLAADTSNIVITDETALGANDGTITMAVIDAQGPIEYRLGPGAWQSSPLFSGLAPGSYSLQAREVNEPTCTITYNFAIQASGAFPITIEKTDETVKGAQDGTITITPGGGTAPYEYSIDGGSTYQAGNSFIGLAPGNYPVVVRDNGANTSAANVTINQGIVIYDGVSFTKNPIPYQRQQTAESGQPNYRIYNEVRIESTPGSNNFEKKIAMELEPEINGSATFYLQQAFKAVFNPQPPSKEAVGNTLYRLTDRSAVYKNAYGDLFNDLEVPTTLAESGTFLAVYGGVSKKQYPGLDYFTSWLPANKKFMTWLPYGGIEIDSRQEFYLQYFVSGVPSQLRLMCDLFYDDNTSTLAHTLTTRTGNIAYGDLYVVPCGAEQSGALAVDPAKNVTSYRLWLEDNNGTALTDKFTLKLSRFRRPNTRYFIYRNSLGAHEVLRTTGKAMTKATVQKDTMQVYLGHDYAAGTPEVEAFNATLQDSQEHSTGFLTGKTGLDYLKALRDVLLTTDFHDITDGTRKPLIVLADSMDIQQDEEYRYFLRFKCAEPYIEQNFTPGNL